METKTNEKQIQTNSIELNSIMSRISKLEDENKKITLLLNNEIKQRKAYENSCSENYDEINLKVNEIEKSCREFNENYTKILGQNKAKTISDENNGVCGRVDEIINIEIQRLNSELASYSLKLDLIEKRFADFISDTNSNFTVADRNMNSLSKEIEALINFKRQTVQNFEVFKSDFIQNEEANESFVSEIREGVGEFSAKLKEYDEFVLNTESKFQNLHIKLDTHARDLEQSLKRDIEIIGDKLKKFTFEIENFEKHILNEHEKFTDFTQRKLAVSNDSIKGMINALNEDIVCIKNDMRVINEGNRQLRSDFAKGLNESEGFLMKRYDSLFNIINKT